MDAIYSMISEEIVPKGDMFDSAVLSSRSALSPRQELELVHVYLENARKNKDREVSLALCDDAETALSRIKKAARKILTTTLSAEDQDLRNGFADAYFERGEVMTKLGCKEQAQLSYKKAEKWGHRRKGDQAQVVSSATGTTGGDIAQVPESIFPDDLRQPAVDYTLPEADERLSDTGQLVYCLGILQVTLSPDETFEPAVAKWRLATENNADEKDRLKTMGTDLIRNFKRDELKDAKAVSEVVSLAPVLEKNYFRFLLKLFADAIVTSSLLDMESLEGLAQLIQNAPEGYLNSDDLVTILRNLNSRLQITHSQSPDYIYDLTFTISNVLDAMADTKVSGVNRIELHKPLSDSLAILRSSSDPYLVYQAAYAFQALQCVPDDESPWQATKRRAGILVKGISGVVSAVKGLDVNGFIEGLGHLHEGLGEVIQVAKIGYEGVSALVDGGQGLLTALKDGLSFSQTRTWYAVLRFADTLLRGGELAKFKTLVCKAPCRRDVAFQLGLCERLGNLAASARWDAESRQGAVAFLGEIYRDDEAWGQQALVKQSIVHILMELAFTCGSALPGAEILLEELESNGNDAKMTLYRNCRKDDRSFYPLKIVLPTSKSPSLLDRVQNKPDVEADLRRLRKHRTKGQSEAVYIPPQAKANLQASDDNLFDLTTYVNDFLKSEHCKVMLLLGDSGVGKSTFNWEVECSLWRHYIKQESRIPLHINLPGIDKPQQDMIAKYLRKHGFTEPQIRELKDHREFVLICDGYDESQQMLNLYTSNQLNEDGQWRAQMVISCRSEYLPSDYKDLFQPMDRNHKVLSGRFQEAVIAPFSEDQILDYIQRYVAASRPVWQITDYLEALDNIPNLRDLVKNPFLLTLSLEVLPRLVDPSQDVSATRVTRVALYDQFVEHWLERGKKRLFENKDLSRQEKKALQRLSDEGFTQNGIAFMKRLASAIYKEQAGHPVVEYSHFKDEKTWKVDFFGQDDVKELLREACPLSRSGNQYQFIHRSMLEYGLARAVFEPQESKKTMGQAFVPARRASVGSMFSFEDQAAPEEESVDIQQTLDDHPLTWRSFAGEPSILQFLAERVQQEPLFEQQLLAMVERSKVDKEVRKAAANAMTILVRAGVPFIGADLTGIQIPGADISGGQFESVQLPRADLRKVKFLNTWLRKANLSNARMADVQFGEWPSLMEDDKVGSCVYSPDGKTCAVSVFNGTIGVYDTSTWARVRTLIGHTDHVTSTAYSPGGQQIASGSRDNTVRLWDAQSGAPGPILIGHTNGVTCVAYSPSDYQIASGSWDMTVRLWNAQTGISGLILEGHTSRVNSVAYSPLVKQIASAGDKTVRLWDAQTGAPRRILIGHTNIVNSVVYSPSGQQIASGSYDGTVRLWDAQTGEPGPILSGHTSCVNSVVYSPNGQQIASGSIDKTVRLWDTQTGAPGPTLRGHTGYVSSVVYSPNGQQIASGSTDKTVRLWDAQMIAPIAMMGGHTDSVRIVICSPHGQQIASGGSDNKVLLWNAQTGAPGPILIGHTQRVESMVYSPSGKQIASGSSDNTVRLWDAQTGAPGPILIGHTLRVESVVYSPSGQHIASGSDDKTVRLWDAQTGVPGPILIGHSDYVESVVYSPSGQQIASGSDDMTVRLWDAQTGAPGPILHGHTGVVNSVLYSPSGQQIASVSDDMTVRLWDVQTGAPGPILSGNDSTIISVAYSPSSHQIALGSTDKTVRLWDTQTDEPGLVLEGHTNYVCSVVYSPCGQQIASGSHDNTVQLWDVNSGQCLAVVDGFNGRVSAIAWIAIPEGIYFATGCEDKSVRVWQILEEEGVYQVNLQWSTVHETLVASNASIQNTHGLSNINIRLLEQRGAVGKPIPPSDFREATKKVLSMTSVVSRLKMQSNQSAMDTFPKTSSRAIPSAKPTNSAKETPPLVVCL